MSQFSLFDEGPEHIDIDVPDGMLRYWPRFIEPEEGRKLFLTLRDTVSWEQTEIVIAGQLHKIPRLNAWYGEAGADYSYSGQLFRAMPWLPELAGLKRRVEQAVNGHFNSALINLYRDGRDSVDWHSDDEPELGRNPVIASISLGALRRFQFKHRTRRDLSLQTLELGHGSLLLMAGEFQHYWKHRLPKMSGMDEPRINITYRYLVHSN
ncbi:MAG: alpha-ketoglutarate-dependent dioxygenase AlkB [Porticoccaceae bacterium]